MGCSPLTTLLSDKIISNMIKNYLSRNYNLLYKKLFTNFTLIGINRVKIALDVFLLLT